MNDLEKKAAIVALTTICESLSTLAVGMLLLLSALASCGARLALAEVRRASAVVRGLGRALGLGAA
jgi:hypothetical protein